MKYVILISIIIFVFICLVKRIIKNNNYHIKGAFVTKYICNEHKIYDNLSKHYHCLCGRRIEHFPKRMKTCLDYFFVVTRNVGKTLVNVSDNELECIHDIDEQLKCIAYNLARCNVHHGDILKKNICIDKNGCIYLIDYDIAFHQFIHDDYKRCFAENTYKHLKHQFSNL